MPKVSGLGDNFYIDGYDLSGDISSVDQLSGPLALLDSTAIKQYAFSRIPGKRDGTISFTSFFNNVAAPPPYGEHNVLKTLPTTDRISSYFRGSAIGNPAASIVAKQINYDPTRNNDGSLLVKVDNQGNSYGLEWGNMITPGIRTDTTATAAGAGNSYDTLASLAFGGQLYIHVFSVTGTSVTLTLYDSADNSSFASVAGFATSGAIAPGGAPTAMRIASANTVTIRRYVAIASTGTFSNAQFAVMLNKNPIAGVVF